MSYFDDYDDDVLTSEDEDIYYHNYSVDYANQILGGHHALSSCLPLMRRRHRRKPPRLVRVATLDQMPIVPERQNLPPLYSRSKYNDEEEPQDTDVRPAPTPLPSLEATGEELERRATRRTQPGNQTSNVPPPTGQSQYRPMTEAELIQARQQQELFQQHLLNMQRHLNEQAQQPQEQRQQEVPASCPRRSERRAAPSFYDVQRDDDQEEIAQLIDTDPYFAAAMEDFARTHGLLGQTRHRTHSGHSSSRHAHHLCKRHQKSEHFESHSPLTSSSSSSLTSVTSAVNSCKTDPSIYRELHAIRRTLERYLHDQRHQPTFVPVPWGMAAGPMATATGVHYPTVPPVRDYEPALVRPSQPRPAEPARAVYQNVINAVRDVLDRRPSAERDQPLKPSNIDPSLKHVYTRRPRIPPPPIPTTTTTPLRPPQQQRRRSSQLSTPPATNIPPAPPYEPLVRFSSASATPRGGRTLSYGSHQTRSNVYDTLRLGHYIRVSNNYR